MLKYRMYFVPNELIHQFEDFSIIIHIMFKDLITILVSNNNQGTLIIYDFKTELVMPRKVAGFRLYDIIFAYSLVYLIL